MRIVMIGTRGIPARSGGAERVVEELTRELAGRGHDVLVYGRRHYLGPDPRPPAGRVVVTGGLPGKHLDTPTHSYTAMRDALRREVDVLHVHSPGPALWCGMAARAGLPVVFTVHAPDWRREKWSAPAKRVLRLGLCRGMRHATAVTAVSQPLADDLSAAYGRPVACVPNGVRPRPAPPPERLAEWGLRPDGYVLNVGRVVPEKRLDALLRAWRETPIPGRELVVVGEMNSGSYARRCRREAPGGVRFLGERCGEALAALYAHAALVVQPSGLEGMSLVLLEAAVHGRCVLAADIPANRAALGEAALYWSGRTSELGPEIRRCLDSEPLRAEMGERARRHVLSTRDWSAPAGALEGIYQEALEA